MGLNRRLPSCFIYKVNGSFILKYLSNNREKTIHQFFEEQVLLYPSNIAVVYEGNELSYQKLNEKANQLAHKLIEEGVIADSLVAICVERSLEMIIGLFAILKAGGAYVPIDPNYPSDRIEYMIEDSNAKVLLTLSTIKSTLPKTLAKIIILDTSEFLNYSTSNPNIALSRNALIYVIYTSGSTGKPKGVMVEHKGQNNLLNWYSDEFNVNINSSTILISSLSFDLTQKNIFVEPLANYQK